MEELYFLQLYHTYPAGHAQKHSLGPRLWDRMKHAYNLDHMIYTQTGPFARYVFVQPSLVPDYWIDLVQNIMCLLLQGVDLLFAQNRPW